MGEVTIELTPDERELIHEYRRLRAMKHGDMTISIKNENLVKLWVTTQTTRKVDLDDAVRGKRNLLEVTDEQRQNPTQS